MPFFTFVLIAAIAVAVIMMLNVLILSRLYQHPKPGYVLVITNMSGKKVSKKGQAVIPVFHSYAEIDIRPRILNIQGQKYVIEVQDDEEAIMRFADAFVDRADTEIAAVLAELWGKASERADHLNRYGLIQRSQPEAA